jgi:hypothetical protein
MATARNKQFGKRRPPPVEEPARPNKRSGYVALFLMGTVAVGAGAYAMMPSERCDPAKPPAAGQPVPPGAAAAQNQSCRTSSRGSSYGGRSSGSSFYDSSSSSSSHSSSGGLAIPSKSTTTRGGFGSFGHAVASSFSRGG